MQLQDLFLAPEDLFRLGNASDPRLTHVRRPKDVDTMEVNGITVVIANGKGIFLSTKDRIEKSQWLAGCGRLPREHRCRLV